MTSTSPGAISHAHSVRLLCKVLIVGLASKSAAVDVGFLAARIDVALPCGSRSITSVAKPRTVAAPANPKRTEVFPTPPLRLKILTTRMASSLRKISAVTTCSEVVVRPSHISGRPHRQGRGRYIHARSGAHQARPLQR